MMTIMVKAPLAAAAGAAVLGMLPLVVAAQDAPSSSTTVDIFMPIIAIGTEASWAGSVVTAAPSATTYSLQCLGTVPEEFPQDPAEDAEAPCGELTVAQGPSTWSMYWEIEGVITSDSNCDPFDLKTSAVCTLSMSYHPSDSSIMMPTAVSTTDTMTGALPTGPVTLTAGLDKLPVSSTPAATGSGSASGSASASASTSVPASASGTTAGTATGTTDTTGAPSSTGAAARCTSWIAAGGAAAAAAVAAAM